MAPLLKPVCCIFLNLSNPTPALLTKRRGERHILSPAFPPTTGAGEKEAGSRLEKESISHTQLLVPPSRGAGGGSKEETWSLPPTQFQRSENQKSFPSFLRLPGGSESKFRNSPWRMTQ